MRNFVYQLNQNNEVILVVQIALKNCTAELESKQGARDNSIICIHTTCGLDKAYYMGDDKKDKTPIQVYPYYIYKLLKTVYC